MVMEGVAVDVAEIVRLGDAQHHALHVVVVVAHDVLWRDFLEVPRTDAELERLKMVSLPMPVEPPSRIPWLILTAGCWMRCAQ